MLPVFLYIIVANDGHIGGTLGVDFVALGMILYSPLILLLVAPAKAVNRRLIFLGLGVLLLIALNEVSKLGLDLTAHQVQG
jgi:hypothetical protein